MQDTYDLIVIGSGAMGLAAAYQAGQQSKRVLVLEADEVPGGMAAHFDLAGLSIERYYHFICKTDHDTFGLLEELGISDALKWRETKMGYFVDGNLHKWGNPVALLGSSLLGPIEKFRYALMAFYATKRTDFAAAEDLTAPVWLQRWLGRRGYEKLWHRLFYLKFYEYTDAISASWIGTRIKRIGLSRRSLMTEELGYLEGGTETLVRTLVDAIEAQGGTVRTGEPAREVLSESGRVTGVRTDGGTVNADRVISTVPTPIVPKLVPQLNEATLAKYEAIPNIGVACLIFKLRKSVTGNFWLNIIDDDHPIPGLIEFSNLRPTDDTVVYAPYYMPVTQERWNWSDDALLAEAMAAIKAVNPDITDEDVIASEVSRLRYAQPVCVPNFLDILPPIQTEIEGLQIADTCFYYPEDRGISESIGLGRSMARHAFQ